MKQRIYKNKSYFILFIGVLSVSTGAIWIRLAMDEAKPLIIALYRLAFSALLSIFMAMVVGKKQTKPFGAKSIALIVLSGFFLAMHFASWISSLELTSVSSSVVLVSTTPLWVAILSPVLLKEPVNRRFYTGMILAMLGGVIIAMNENCVLDRTGLACAVVEKKASLTGLALALTGAWMGAGYMLIGRKLSAQIDTARYTASVYAIAAVILFLVVFFNGDSLTGYSSRTWLLFFAMATIPQILGHTVLNYSLQSLPATTVSLALLGEPVGSTVLAMVFLKEFPTMLQVVGGILILVGISYAVLYNRPINAA
ncbi:MAG: DMT family transporter [Chloroflexi bacterium]|nr:DMT family transporter [Chloroflexota bacterium]